MDWNSLARAHFRQAVAKEHSLGAMAVARRGGRAPGVKAEIEGTSSNSGSSSSASSSNSNSNSNGNNSLGISGNGSGIDSRRGSGSGSFMGVRLDRADSMDNTINPDDDTMKMDVTEGRIPSLPSLPSSPSSSARALRDSLVASALAHRAVALSVGLVGAGVSDGVNR